MTPFNTPAPACDLSVIVTVHSETVVGGPTMRAADAAIEAAKVAGFSVQRLIALDSPTAGTARYFNQPAFDHWERVALTQGDLGRARNEVVKDHARGSAIAFLDADDLFSQNWLAEGMNRLRAAEARGERMIVHPELNWLFDGAQSVYWNPEQDDPLWTPYYLYVMNYYDSLCLTPRAAHLELPYVHRDIPNGLSFQDWQFSIETTQAGWRHGVARDTIIFKRRRDVSLVTESQGRRAVVRALPAMRIDRVAALGFRKPCTEQGAPPPLTPFERLRKLIATSGEAAAQDAPPPIAALCRDIARVPAQNPNYGPVLDARIRHANARTPATPSKAYNAIARSFGTGFYLAANPDILSAPGVNPREHYMRAGAREGRDPHPLFGAKAYLARYPGVAKSDKTPFHHWLQHGQLEGKIGAPFTHFEEMARMLGLTAAQAEVLYAQRYADLRQRLGSGALGAQVAQAARFDPTIEMGWIQALQIKIPPFHSDLTTQRVTGMFRALEQARHCTAQAVIVVNKPRWGGARRMEGHLADALVARYGADQVVVITTDGAGMMPSGKFPQGVRHVDLPTALQGKLPRDFNERSLVEVLRALAPKVVFNVNSRLMWDALGSYGQALSASMRLFGCLFCNERTNTGAWTGYPLRRFYRHFDLLAGVCTDSQFLADQLRRDYMLPAGDAARITVLRGPVDHSIALAPLPEGNPRPQIFWSGRMDAQKRVDLLYEIAALMPQAEFHVWGEKVLKGGPPLPEPPRNITLHGAYARFAELPLERADLWLYTSGWDGIPQTLLEVGMTGVPIVGTSVGGTGEVLHPTLAQALPQEAHAGDYVTAIKTVLAQTTKARTKARALREYLIQRHTAESYSRAIAEVVGPAVAPKKAVQQLKPVARTLHKRAG
jgi:glycosyltransferase involved in cell wall biosynthesis